MTAKLTRLAIIQAAAFAAVSWTRDIHVPVPIMTDLVMAVAGVHNTKCIEVLIHDNMTRVEREDYSELFRALSSKQITKIYDMDGYIEEKDRENDLTETKCFRPIRVTIGNDLSRAPFEKVTQWSGNAFSKPVSVVFMNSTIPDFFANVILPYNSITVAIVRITPTILNISEVYRVDTGFPLRNRIVGNWSLHGGIILDPRTVFARRYDFEGKVFRTGSVEKWPFTTFRGFLEKDEPWDGLYCMVWRELERLLHFSSVNYRGDASGIQGPDGQWNGIVGMLRRNEIDVIVADLRMTPDRIPLMDFTYPLITSWYQVYYKQPGYNLQWSAVFEPFGYDVWMAILGWIAAGSLCFSFCYHCCRSVGLEPDTREHFTVLGSLFFMIRTLCLQDCSSVPVTAVCRIIFLLSYVTAAVLIPAYSASLISSLTQRYPVRPFDSLEGLLADGTYKLNIEENTAEYTYFSQATEKTLKSIYEKLVQPIPTIYYPNYRSYGLEMLCRYDKVALFDVQQGIRMQDTGSLPCELLSLTQPLTKVDEGIAFAKGNPFATYIHHHVHRMTEAGLIRRIKRKVTPMTVNSISPWNPVKVEEVFQVFSFLALGMILSVVVLAAEVIVASVDCRRGKAPGVAAVPIGRDRRGEIARPRHVHPSVHYY